MKAQIGTLDRTKKNQAKWRLTRMGVGQSMAIAILAQLVLGFVVCQISTAEVSHQSDRANGTVLPPSARPFGYSLARMAEVTAVFNSGDHTGQAPATPIQMLYTNSTNTFDVPEGTVLYVPALFIDDSPPIVGDFPYAAFTDDDSDVPELLRNYLYGENEFGFDSITITVDGRLYPLGPGYAVAVTTPPLKDVPPGTLGGTHYMPVAAYVSPLSKGSHTVEIDVYGDGLALLPLPAYFPNGIWSFSIVYTVNVH